MDIWYGGHLEHSKKCSGMHFWDPQPTLTIRFLSRKKNFFQNFGVRKIAKYFFWLVGSKNDFWDKILIEKLKTIDEIWEHLNIGTYLKKSILTSVERFLGPFLGVDSQNHLREPL